jgi:hypothetical protein
LWNVLRNDNYNVVFSDYVVNADTLKKVPNNVLAKLDWNYIKSNVSSVGISYKAIGAGEKYFKYIGRGFRYGIEKTQIEWPLWNFDVEEIESENIETFERIVWYCKCKGIELIFIQSALPPHRLKNENMDEVHDYFTNLCNNYNVPFYDMNYIKKEYLNRTDDDYVDIDGHMLGELAERHTKALADILNSDDKDIYFYNSYEEVLDNLN